ncbi:DUF1385 domain-containing protein [candidate division GN15 bacterium]|nr:DUF1385 domain-containing protein [candidate division GN15 bacterium]
MPDMNVGGQAVIEGVMMRSKDRIATAVRKPNGEIVVKTQPYTSLALRKKILGLPMIRGAVTFVEMLLIGIRTLNFSAEVAVEEAEREEAERKGETHTPRKKGASNLYLAFTAVAALALGIGVFFWVPLAVAGLVTDNRDAVEFNLVAGAIRMAMFILYVWGISFLKELHRVFEYHGAEHKSIYALESGSDLTPELAARHTRFHPRCGTSFIFIVALLAIGVYSVSDSLFALWVGHAPDLWTRFAVHLALLPVVAGTSYELLKLSGKTRDNALTRILIQPGLWLQRITTKEPSMDQLEVAIAALEAALGVEHEQSKLTCKRTAVF